jgi:hypothetical protein
MKTFAGITIGFKAIQVSSKLGSTSSAMPIKINTEENGTSPRIPCRRELEVIFKNMPLPQNQWV